MSSIKIFSFWINIKRDILFFLTWPLQKAGSHSWAEAEIELGSHGFNHSSDRACNPNYEHSFMRQSLALLDNPFAQKHSQTLVSRLPGGRARPEKGKGGPRAARRQEGGWVHRRGRSSQTPMALAAVLRGARAGVRPCEDWGKTRRFYRRGRTVGLRSPHWHQKRTEPARPGGCGQTPETLPSETAGRAHLSRQRSDHTWGHQAHPADPDAL